MLYHESKCQSCGRQVKPVKILRTDPKTKKKWLVYTCPKCDYQSDLEPYTRDYNPFEE